MRPGDIVRIPAGIYGDYALIERANKSRVDVYAVNGSTGYELAYEPSQVVKVGCIEPGKTYSTAGGSRFVRCVWKAPRSREATLDVKTRIGHDGEEETRRPFVRRMAFERLIEMQRQRRNAS